MQTSPPGDGDTPHGSVDAGLIDALAQTAFAIMAVLNKVGAEHDLSLTQLRVLAILRDRRLRMTALAGYLGLDKSTMTGLVARAEKRGLLERAPNPTDGRAVDVLIAPAGAELADLIYHDVARSMSGVVGRLTPADRSALRTLLERMSVPVAGDPRREPDMDRKAGR